MGNFVCNLFFKLSLIYFWNFRIQPFSLQKHYLSKVVLGILTVDTSQILANIFLRFLGKHTVNHVADSLICLTKMVYIDRRYGDLCPFIQGLLEWPFIAFFSANISLWNQYKYIAFNVSLCRIVIILYTMLIITRIFNEKQIS